LVDLDGSFFSLSETAAQMLKEALETSEPETVQRIAANYHADLDRFHADLTALLRTLRNKGLIRRRVDRLVQPRLRGVLALAISYPLLRIAVMLHHGRLKVMALLTLARLSFALAGWARTVEAWQKCLKGGHPPSNTIKREQLIDTIESATRRSAAGLPSIACKERALTCWFLLHSAGISARLVMGVRPAPFSSHCWCEVDDGIVADSPEQCHSYTPVICYDGK